MSKQNKKQQFMYTSCSTDVLSLQFSIFMNNLSSYCGLINAKIRASDIDVPVQTLLDACKGGLISGNLPNFFTRCV